MLRELYLLQAVIFLSCSFWMLVYTSVLCLRMCCARCELGPNVELRCGHTQSDQAGSWRVG